MPPEHPLLLLPKFGPPLPRVTRQFPMTGTYRIPPRAEQSGFVRPKLESMLEASVFESASGASPENILVLETVGRLDGFRTAVNAVPNLKWLAEIDLDEMESDDRFYDRPKIGPQFFKKWAEGVSTSNSRLIFDRFLADGLLEIPHNLLKTDVNADDIRNSVPRDLDHFSDVIVDAVLKQKSKPLAGRMYLSLSNRQALYQIKRLFDEWDRGGRLPFGAGEWSNIFAQLRTVRFWDVQDRIEDTGILDYWREEVEMKRGTASLILFEAEFCYQTTEVERRAQQQRVIALVQAEGGSITAQCHIPEIHFHAIKIQLPVEGIERVLAGDYSALFRSGGVLLFRPTAQCCVSSAPDGILEQIEEVRSNLDEPVVALLDGLPFANHALLQDFLIIDDPDDFLSDYQAREQCHGTGMASLICHGELDAASTPLQRKIYVRPILKPDVQCFSGPRPEKIPENVFFEDLLERSVRRMFVGDGVRPTPVAPTVKIINLSVADKDRMFHSFPGPTARLIDWLSYKYGVLFCVSAGNILDPLFIDVDPHVFSSMDTDTKNAIVIDAINSEKRNRRIFSPSESINSITVGALHDDHSTPVIIDGRLDLLSDASLPSPISACGHGFRHSIKPEILLPGGRQLYRHNGEGDYCLDYSPQPPGQKVASVPVGPGERSRVIYTRGTSNATALATRNAALIHESLESLMEETGIEIPDSNIGPLLKALLVHGASWGDSGDIISAALDLSGPKIKTEVARFLGYGKPSLNKSTNASYSRATAIGFGTISKDQRHEFRFPLPASLRGQNCWRRLTVTLAWFTPISVDNRKYRKAALAFEGGKGFDEEVGGKRNEANHNQVKNGTVQHEIIEGAKVITFQDGEYLVIPIQCREDAGALDASIHYGLAVSLEVKDETILPIYEEVKTAIEIAIREQVGTRV
jgi:hypothetical protein